MPHIKLEHTENVQWKNPIQDIFPKLHTVLVKNARIKSENCKSRAIELKNYYSTGNNHSDGFIHLEISLLSGRTESVKKNIGRECHRIILSFIENIAEVQVSMELRDMDKYNYFTTNKLL